MLANYYNEFDPFAAAWLRELICNGHIPFGVVDDRDIKDVTPADLVGYTQCHFFAGIGGWSLALQLAGHPVFDPMMKNRDMLKKVFQAHMIPVDEVLLTQEEIDAAMARAEAQAQEAMAAQAPVADDPAIKQRELDLKEAEIDSKVEIANMQADTARVVAQFNRDTQMMIFAEKMNMSLDEIEAKLATKRMEIDHKERVVAAEAAITEQRGPNATSGGGLF